MAISSVVEIDKAVSQIIEYEHKPIDKLESDKADLSLKNTSLSQLDSSLEELQSKLQALTSDSVFLSNKSSSSNSSIVTASTSSDAVQTVYQVDVVRLAQVARITSSSSLNLSDGTYAVLQSGEEINASGGSSVTVNPNVVFASGSAAVGFDLSKLVVSGSFKVNDAAITVTGSDTIYTILSKINSSTAGVTATFDSANDSVVLTSSSSGTGQTISVSDDSSGFLEAVKLTETGGNPAPVFTDGTQPDFYNALDQTALVDGSNKIVDGYFSINDITFTVNTQTDSLYSVLNKINNSKAEVSAFYDDVTGKVTISSRGTGKDVYFANDTSKFLENINVMDQSGDLDSTAGIAHYEGTSSQVIINGEVLNRDGNSFSLGGTTFNLQSTGTAKVNVSHDTQKAVDAVKAFVTQYNSTMDTIGGKLKTTLKGERSIINLQRKLQQSIFRTVTNEGSLSRLSQVGLSLVTTGGYGLGKLKFTQSDFLDALSDSKDDVYNLFASDTDSDGTNDDTGFANITNTYIENLTKNTNGIFAVKTNGNNKLMERLQKRIEREEEKLSKREADLRKQYEKLNSAVTLMDQQVQRLQSFSSIMSSITSSYYNK